MVKKKKFRISLGQKYLLIMGIFIFGFLTIFISPAFTGKSYSYEEVLLNEYQTLSNNIQIALTKKEYNPEKEIMRLDFSMKEISSNSSLSNITYEISSSYIESREPLSIESVRVNDNYIIAIIKNVPEDFSILSVTIVPKYIHPDIEKNDDLKDRSIKMYVNESDKIINTDIKIEDKEYYEKEYILFQQESIKKQIKANKEKIQTQKLAISELKKSISNIEDDLVYQTEEELVESTTQINTHVSNINQYQKEIETLQNENMQLEEKIKLLDEKMRSI
ncbi:hypothetical protein DES36_11957 [Alkalibaculum bacchi]|uniref:Uncharacterized protein n=1 Tax=Alkalibaculum bacchi TaxID=645887 RepID=A0A366HYX8_9FIRM|nr:hypothetical protein [Alkalibaculum bacchi]RBP59332.1 hypothetical protein DES36_11957 [Alkalibaculum bacchi]